MATLYKCPNIGNCSKADQGENISIITGAPTQCPECDATLILAKGVKTANNNAAILVGIVVVLLLISAGAAWFFLQEKNPAETPAPVAVTSPAPVSSTLTAPPPAPLPVPKAVTAQTLLRFHGSNTVGGKLLPALATAFLQQEGYTNIHKEAGANEAESFIIGEHNGHSEQIEIQEHGSDTAFNDLKANLCDIGMSSRKIKLEEQQSLLSTHGDLTSNASEHVIALDGIALIVHPSNSLRALSVAQIADIFSGTITDWSQVGGRAGAITIYARDDKSGTYDFFKEKVLQVHGKTLTANAQRFEDSTKLSNAVANDSAGIGFIGLNYIGSNKVLALSDTGVEARKPSVLTVKTEDYLLSRRLYLYTAEKSTNPNVYKFIEFAVGSSVQPIVASTGLVNLDVTPVASDPDDARNQSARWQSLTKGAVEIATRFRFRTGSDDLDTRAYRDIGRIVGVLSQPQYQNKKIILIGFADSSGSPAANQKLSQSRADIIKKELAPEGLEFSEVVGLGAEAFIAPNDTPENKEKNRRVEVWLK
jgi:phosphate transport system substrate-binding protein